MQSSTAIGPLTNVSLNLTVSGGIPVGMLPQSRNRFDFFYGIGTDGLSAFERQLHGLSAGARLEIHIEADQMPTYFEHLRCAILEVLKIQPPFTLTIEVLSVRPVTDRELVHALANKDGSGCDSDCGCGCSC